MEGVGGRYNHQLDSSGRRNQGSLLVYAKMCNIPLEHYNVQQLGLATFNLCVISLNRSVLELMLFATNCEDNNVNLWFSFFQNCNDK